MRAAAMSPFAISSTPIFILVAISDASSTRAGGGEAGDGETGRGPVADGRGRCTTASGVTSLAAPRAPTGAGPVATAGPDGRSESRFGALRFAAGLDGAGRASVWLDAVAN